MKKAPFGAWQSPIQADQIVAGALRLSGVMCQGDAVYWNELRPAEAGRCVVVRRAADGTLTDCVPPPFNARTRVHEYGGGACLVDGDDVVFSNYADQRLYRVTPGGEPKPITPDVAMRYADGVVDARRGRILCVREDHTDSDREAVNTLVTLAGDGDDAGSVLVEGNDFYAAPRLSPDGSQLAWLTWNHPDMPWDAADLWVASVNDDGSLGEARHIAGGNGESCFQPEWSPDGQLYFVCDKTDWWNLHRLRDGAVECVLPMEAEFGMPQWVFGMRTYAFLDADMIACAWCCDGLWRLGKLDCTSGVLTPVDTPFNTLDDVQASHGRAVFLGGTAARSTAVVSLDMATGDLEVLRESNTFTVDAGYIAKPEPVAFPTESGLMAHALFYGPKNAEYGGPDDELPPLVVMIHGGPTSATKGALNLKIQYYTSRGIAVLDVNYGGSTGYGRAYRERLFGTWGVVDVDDCVNGARYLADQGKVDAKRMAITGGSAGGYTTLSALAFRDVFAAGASHFGVSDCEALAKDTHKFESRYLDKLIGPYPERRDLYIERSPIHASDRLDCPVIFFQGLEDKIVPPNQAEMMVDALRAKGIPVAYVAFEGEQHGFRQAGNIRRALEGELYFFSRVFDFETADELAPVDIENM